MHSAVPRPEWAQVPIGGGGYIRHVCVHPRIPDAVFASCDVGGMFRSLDGGRTWRGGAEGLEHPDDFCVACIVVGADDTLFAPTGAWRGTSNLYRSDDLGLSWRRTNARPLPNLRSSGWGTGRGLRHILAADPRRAGRLLLATPEDGVLVSLDGGGAWHGGALAGARLAGLFAAPSDPDVLYAPTLRLDASDPGGVHVSRDGGRTWSHAGAGLDATCVAVHPGDPDRAWVATRWDGVWSTRDGGRTWSSSNGSGARSIPTGDGRRAGGEHDARTEWRLHVSSVCVDPTAPERVYVSTMIHDGLFGSADGGATWDRLPVRPVEADGWWAGGQNTPPGPRMLATVHLVADPHVPGRLYSCDFFAVFRSDDHGRSFRACWRGLENTYVQHFWWGRPRELFLGLNDITLFRSDDAGATTRVVPTYSGIVRPWERINLGNALVIDASRHPRRLLLGTLEWHPRRVEGGVLASDDDGATWRFLDGLPAARVHGLAQCPDNPDTLLCGIEGRGVFRSLDGGLSWARSDAGIAEAGRLYGSRGLHHVRGGVYYPTHRGDIVFDPVRRGVVFLAAGEFGMYRSDDSGATWSRIGADVPVDYVQALRLDAAGVLHAACGDTGLWASRDEGGSWARLGGFPCHALAVHPSLPGRLLAGAPGELHVSGDGGVSWAEVPLGEGMPRIAALAWDPETPGRVFVGTLGRGAFVGELRA